MLLEPPAPAGFVSGGYRYQERVFAHLAGAGEGQRLAVEPKRLESEIAAIRAHTPSARIVVDGLFVELRAAPLPPGVIALLHMTPSRADWCSASIPVIATGERTAAAVAARAASVTVVRPGLDSCFRQSMRRPADDETVRIVCVGTISPAKAQLRLVRTLRELAPGWRLRLLGDLATHPAYVVEVAAAATDMPIALPGVLPPEALADAFADSDLYVSLSVSESFGMAVAEAAACGVPVLALATGAIAELVEHETNGWLLPKDVTDVELRNLLSDLIADPERLRTARAAARPSPLADWQTVSREFARACGLALS